MIPLFKPFLPPAVELMPKLEQVLYSGQISEGPIVQEFERKFGEYIQNPNVLSFSSGTAALHIALLLAGVGPGDEVISTPMTAEPTNMAIKYTGANIVWADVDQNGNMLADSIELTDKTKAVMVVHYGGIPANLYAIDDAVDGQVPIIEDGAHALGAKYAGRPIGNYCDYTMFSLQAIKHITTIDGGMLICHDHYDLPKGRRLRWFGIDRQLPRIEVNVSEIGYKYHMTNLPATIGLMQLNYIDWVVSRHIANGRFYDWELRNIPGIHLCKWDARAEPSYWFYTVLAEDRDGLSRWLTEKGIANGQVHKRNDWHTVFESSKRELPGLDWFYSHMLHIPCGWWLSEGDREYIVDTIKGGW